VTLVRAAVLISAPIGTVFDLALPDAARSLPWLGRVRLVETDRPRQFVVAGRRLRRVCRFAETGAGTLLTDELRWQPPLGRAGGLAGTLLLRRRLLQHLVTGASRLRAAAELRAAADRSAPAGPGELVVVGAALLDGAGRVLAAQRSGPAELAGRWEFPGGKVEPGESETAALARECQEELGVQIHLDARLGADLPVQGGGAVLRVWTGRITAGHPTPHEHRALRWLAPHELDDVDWLPADRPLIDLLRTRPSS
jgi:8-oxo-dGTP diphosphatase